ncbi:hypothetical protein ACFE04_017752 [Oxalis oulophora]
MGGDYTKCVFPLTSLQIGDLQSYLSDLSLFLALKSNKFYILVDNRPWLRDLGAGPAHLWQLMVTKSRLSPFANSKRKQTKKGKQTCTDSEAVKSKKIFDRWFSLIDATTLSQKRVSLPVDKLRSSLQFSSELHRTLYGLIVFEVEWDNVRGINYFNELQTDTSLAVETKFMRRWEFDSIDQASSCISSWFSGKQSDEQLLKEYLDSTIDEIFSDAKQEFSSTIFDDSESTNSDNLFVGDTSLCHRDNSFRVYPVSMVSGTGEPHTPPATGPYKRRKVTKPFSTGFDVDIYSEETLSEIEDILDGSDCSTSDCESSVDPTEYQDVLILMRFNDRDLPFKLRHIIMSDLRLLTLLEAGLPSWVIFLQSYPGFCHIYRPWMCPLARALYVIISTVTVLIGFYDLYKNVPLLKATASRMCGPLFDWIETWEMVSRIKYLGTMLFLHNFEKALKWFLTITRTTRSFFSFIVLPVAKPFAEFLSFLLPTWNILVEVLDSFCSVIWITVSTSCGIVWDLVEFVLSPIWWLISLVWSIGKLLADLATSILYPVFWILWEILYVPVRVVLVLANLVAFIWTSTSDLMGSTWRFVSGIFQIASASKATVSTTYEVSLWRSLWNDLFSQIFRAVRSILNGFAAFFIACNRHRLSIYNHLQDFLHKMFGRAARSQLSDSRHSRSVHGSPRSVNYHMSAFSLAALTVPL